MLSSKYKVNYFNQKGGSLKINDFLHIHNIKDDYYYVTKIIDQVGDSWILENGIINKDLSKNSNLIIELIDNTYLNSNMHDLIIPIIKYIAPDKLDIINNFLELKKKYQNIYILVSLERKKINILIGEQHGVTSETKKVIIDYLIELIQKRENIDLFAEFHFFQKNKYAITESEETNIYDLLYLEYHLKNIIKHNLKSKTNFVHEIDIRHGFCLGYDFIKYRDSFVNSYTIIYNLLNELIYTDGKLDDLYSNFMDIKSADYSFETFIKIDKSLTNEEIQILKKINNYYQLIKEMEKQIRLTFFDSLSISDNRNLNLFEKQINKAAFYKDYEISQKILDNFNLKIENLESEFKLISNYIPLTPTTIMEKMDHIFMAFAFLMDFYAITRSLNEYARFNIFYTGYCHNDNMVLILEKYYGFKSLSDDFREHLDCKIFKLD